MWVHSYPTRNMVTQAPNSLGNTRIENAARLVAREPSQTPFSKTFQ